MVNLQTAIETLEAELAAYAPDADPDFTSSLKLGIEAMKREAVRRRYPRVAPFGLLPGETPEEKEG